MFSWRNKKNVSTFQLKKHALTWSYDKKLETGQEDPGQWVCTFMPLNEANSWLLVCICIINYQPSDTNQGIHCSHVKCTAPDGQNIQKFTFSYFSTKIYVVGTF